MIMHLSGPSWSPLGINPLGALLVPSGAPQKLLRDSIQKASGSSACSFSDCLIPHSHIPPLLLHVILLLILLVLFLLILCIPASFSSSLFRTVCLGVVLGQAGGRGRRKASRIHEVAALDPPEAVIDALSLRFDGNARARRFDWDEEALPIQELPDNLNLRWSMLCSRALPCHAMGIGMPL